MKVTIDDVNAFINQLIFNLKNDLSEENIKITLYQNFYEINQKSNLPVAQNEFERNWVQKFFIAKKTEGLSVRSIQLYASILSQFSAFIKKDITECTTDDIRYFLLTLQKKGDQEATVLNKKRGLSSFYNFLVQENVIDKNPVHAIKSARRRKKVFQPLDDMQIEIMRDEALCERDRAIIELFLSTGMRVGELCNMNIEDVDFENRQCIVLGKGNKERICYLNAKSIFYIKKYLKTRDDMNPALFVSLQKPHDRLKISGVEIFLRKLGKKQNVRIHPHKLRRTTATTAINRGMPIEQVQKLLGHESISTTTIYAAVNQQAVKESHDKLL